VCLLCVIPLSCVCQMLSFMCVVFVSFRYLMFIVFDVSHLSCVLCVGC